MERANQPPPPELPDGPEPLTTLHLRRALGGSPESLTWIVSRFSPLLMAQAEYRLGPALRRQHDPADLVDDVWLVTLPRLTELNPRDGRLTPVLLKFLATTLLQRINNLVRKHVRRGLPHAGHDAGDPGGPGLLEQLPAATSGVVTRAVRSELRDQVQAAIAELDAPDRQVVILRGIEQLPNATVATLLGVAPHAVTMRYSRALERLRARLPDSVFADLQPD